MKIFVRGHNLLRDANSFLAVNPEEGYELREMAYVPEQRCKCCVYYPSNSFATREKMFTNSLLFAAWDVYFSVCTIL